MDFIEFIIKLGKISMDLKKVKAIVEWQELENVTQLRLFFRVLQLLQEVYSTVVKKY